MGIEDLKVAYFKGFVLCSATRLPKVNLRAQPADQQTRTASVEQSLLSGWGSSKKSKYHYRDHSVGQLTCALVARGDKMENINLLPNELLLEVTRDLGCSKVSGLVTFPLQVFRWLSQTELGIAMLVCKKWAQVI